MQHFSHSRGSLLFVTPTHKLESEFSPFTNLSASPGQTELFSFIFFAFFFFFFAAAQMFDMILSAFKQSHNLDGRIPYCQLEQGGGGHQDESPLGASYPPGSTKVLWVPPKKWVLQKERNYFPRIQSAFIRFSPSDKNGACLVQFLTFRSWQCLLKSTKEHKPCSIHCARSLWSFSAVPLQPFKLLGESKVHIPAAEGSSLMRCLWLK